MSIKQKFKAFFKTREASDAGIELLQKFIIPFSRGMKRSGVDDVLEKFFALEQRGFFYAKANRDFTLPGKLFVAGNRPIYGLGPRAIKRGQVMMIVVDRKDHTAKVEAVFRGDTKNYLLEKFEFETIKDWLDVIA